MKNNKGQNLIEYGLILGIITVALLGMQTYFKRGVQSVIKVVADDYGPQGDPIGDTEIAIKKKIYEEEGKILTESSETGSWDRKIENKGEGAVYSGLSGSNTITGNSVWVGGDYKTRKIEEPSATPPVVPSE